MEAGMAGSVSEDELVGSLAVSPIVQAASPASVPDASLNPDPDPAVFRLPKVGVPTSDALDVELIVRSPMDPERGLPITDQNVSRRIGEWL